MKQNLLLKSLFLLLCMMAGGVGSAWAEESTLTFTAACGGSGTADDNVTWTVTSDGTESAFDNTKGIHYGTSSAQVKYIQLSTSDIPGTISKIIVNASVASGVTASVSVTVGGSAFGGDAQSVGTSATDYTFEGSTSGEIIVKLEKPSKAAKALYVKSVKVTYSTSPLASIALSGTYPTTFYQGAEFSHEGMTVTATYEDDNTKDVTANATFSGYNMNTLGSQTVTVSYTENNITKTAEYGITVNERPKYTVTFSDGGSVTQASADAAVALPSREAIGDYNFAGWCVENIASETTTAPTIITGSYTPTADITLYPVYKRIEGDGGLQEKSVNKTMNEIVSENSYDVSSGSSATCYTSFALNDDVTISTTGNPNCGSFWGTTTIDWRLYQNQNGNVTVSLPENGGYELSSVTFTFTAANSGILIYNSSTVTSAEAFEVSGTSAEFTVGNSSSKTNGQIKITAISVEYQKSGTGATYYWSAPVPTSGYTVALQENTVDSLKWSAKAGNEGEFKQLPLNGVAEGTLVTIKYDGKKRVKSVKAVTDAPAPQYAPKEPSKVSSR